MKKPMNKTALHYLMGDTDEGNNLVLENELYKISFYDFGTDSVLEFLWMFLFFLNKDGQFPCGKKFSFIGGAFESKFLLSIEDGEAIIKEVIHELIKSTMSNDIMIPF